MRLNRLDRMACVCVSLGVYHHSGSVSCSGQGQGLARIQDQDPDPGDARTLSRPGTGTAAQGSQQSLVCEIFALTVYSLPVTLPPSCASYVTSASG